MARARLLLAFVVVVCLGSDRAHAATLCFDDPREVIGAQGHSCCLGGAIDAETAPACGARRYSCAFEDRCELALKGSSTVRVVDETTPVPVMSPALLWAPHACCAEGSLKVRPTREVTPFAPQPLECRLVPGCRVEVELASKYATSTPLELAVADMPWDRDAWEMFLVCARDGGMQVEVCADEWLLPTCEAAICMPGYRGELLAWLDKVAPRVAPGAPSVGPPSARPGEATLFTSEAGRCCVPGTATVGPYYLGGALHAVACGYDATCAPADGDMLFYGDATLLLAKSNAWSQIPAMCEADLAARDGMLAVLEQELAEAESKTQGVRELLQRELATCRGDLAALKNATTTCGPVGGVSAADDRLEVDGDSAQLDLLGNDGGTDLEVIGLSPPVHGIAVWQADGLMTYFPNPDFAGVETLFYQIRDAHGRVQTASVEVTVR